MSGGKAMKHGDPTALVCTVAILLEKMCQLCFGAALVIMV